MKGAIMKKLSLITLAVILSLALCCSLTACSDKTVEQLKNESGALLEGGEFEKGSVLNFDTVDTTSENAEDVFEKLSGIGVEITDKSKAFIYDISVTKDGKEVQPNGKVKITVPMPQDSTETDYSVYHVKDDGEVVKIPSTYADGKLTFETDGFSYYIFVATGYINSNVTPAPVEVTLIATAGEGGSITDGYANGKKVEKGSSVTLTATPNNGYHFVGWYNGNNKVNENVSYTFTVNEDTTLSAKFEKDAPPAPVEVTLTATAGEGGSITDGYANGKKVEKGTSVTLTATANKNYKFKGWYSYTADQQKLLISSEATHTFIVNENTYIQAVFEEKPNGLKLDAHNAGFTYKNGQLTTTVYQIGDANQPQINNVLVYVTYPTQAETSLTIDVDFTRDLGGLDFTKAGTYTVTYTYKADTSLKATLTVQVKEKPSDGSLTEAEWNAAIAYWKAQTNVKVFERTVTSQSYDQQYGAPGADIRIYQLAGTAYSSDGYMEDDELSQQYKGKMTYLVKVGDKYYRYTWNDGDWDDNLQDYVGGFWIKEDYLAQIEYDSALSSNIYAFRDAHGNKIVFSYANFTYDAETKSYKNSDGSITIAFTFDDNKVLTKIVVTKVYEDDTNFSSTTVSTVTFGDAVVNVPTDAKCSFSTGVVTTENTYHVGGYITENGEKVEYSYNYLNDGTVLTLTAVADEGYVFKCWAKQPLIDGEYVWVTYSTNATYTVTVDGEYGTLYAMFEKVKTDS